MRALCGHKGHDKPRRLGRQPIHAERQQIRVIRTLSPSRLSGALDRARANEKVSRNLPRLADFVNHLDRQRTAARKNSEARDRDPRSPASFGGRAGVVVAAGHDAVMALAPALAAVGPLTLLVNNASALEPDEIGKAWFRMPIRMAAFGQGLMR
jgi:hypothetical protein